MKSQVTAIKVQVDSKVIIFVTRVHASVSQDVGMSLSPLFVCVFVCMRTVDAPLCSMFDCTLNSCLLSAHCSGSLIRSPPSSIPPPHVLFACIFSLALLRLPPLLADISLSAITAFTAPHIQLLPPNVNNCDWHCIRPTLSHVARLSHCSSSSDLFLSSPCLSLPPCPWRTGPQLETRDVNRTVPPHSSSLTSFVCVQEGEKEKCSVQDFFFGGGGVCLRIHYEFFWVWLYIVCILEVCAWLFSCNNHAGEEGWETEKKNEAKEEKQGG